MSKIPPKTGELIEKRTGKQGIIDQFIADSGRDVHIFGPDGGRVEKDVTPEQPGHIVIFDAAEEDNKRSEQIKLNNSFDRLPRTLEGQPMFSGNGRQLFEAIGFVFGEDIDELFVSVTPPAGWTIKASSHAMWSYAYDQQGRQRAGIFYKAAFYDRKADARLERRYGIERYLACDEHGKLTPDAELGEAPYFATAVVDHDKSVVKMIGHRARNDLRAGDQLEQQAKEWLNANKPGWDDVLAYWDELPFDRLPQTLHSYSGPKGRAAYETLGFVFGENIDEHLVAITPPLGWTLHANAMYPGHTSIRDQHGRYRGYANFNFPAGHYGANLKQLYECQPATPCDAEGNLISWPLDADGNGIQDWQSDYYLCAIFKDTEPDQPVHVLGRYSAGDYAAQNRFRQSALAWLKENKPGWDNVLAYWDEEVTK